jgi:hypothetical protein
VTLKALKADPAFADLALVRQGRLLGGPGAGAALVAPAEDGGLTPTEQRPNPVILPPCPDALSSRRPFEPRRRPPKAIAELTAGLHRGDRYQTLLGVTGSGKTMTLAHTIANYGKPTLVLSHNKTLAAQLYGELRQFLPRNAVEYFVSYYDYYQPEAYVPATDVYIERTPRSTRTSRAFGSAPRRA